jgi:fatty-acyl-CoA synthase
MIAVVDEAGSDVPRGEPGELIVAGPGLFTGYWRDPDATAAAFTEEGWYRTGDVASLSQDGLLVFHDRARDVIITGGLNVYPAEVERALEAHPAVRRAAVLGYPDAEWGESILAYVVSDGGEAVNADTLRVWLAGRLAGYKKPRRIEFVEDLPLGASGKVLKQELRSALWRSSRRFIN